MIKALRFYLTKQNLIPNGTMFFIDFQSEDKKKDYVKYLQHTKLQTERTNFIMCTLSKM